MSKIGDPLQAQRMKQIQLGMVQNAYFEALRRSGFVGDQSQALRAFSIYRQAAADDDSLKDVEAAVNWTYEQYPALFAAKENGQAQRTPRREVDYSPRPGVDRRAPVGPTLNQALKTTASRASKTRRGM